MSIGKRFVYDLAIRALGERAGEWLDTPRTGIGDSPDVSVTPRSVVESGCPTCIDSVARVIEAMSVAE